MKVTSSKEKTRYRMLHRIFCEGIVSTKAKKERYTLLVARYRVEEAHSPEESHE